MMLTELQTAVDQVAASETYKDLEFFVEHDQYSKERYTLSNEDPPNHGNPDVTINATDATVDVKVGIEL